MGLVETSRQTGHDRTTYSAGVSRQRDGAAVGPAGRSPAPHLTGGGQPPPARPQ